MDSVFNDNTISILRDVNMWFVLIPMLIGVIRYKQLNHQQKSIFGIVVLAVMNDYATIPLREAKLPNLWVLHVYVPVLFILITRLYRTTNSSILSSGTLKLTAIVFVVLSVLNTGFIQSINGWPSNIILVASILYIIFAVTYFSDLLIKPKLEPLESSPLFWFNSGLLLYNASTFLLFLFVTNILDGSGTVLRIGFGLNAIFNLILLSSYSVALWVKPRV